VYPAVNAVILSFQDVEDLVHTAAVISAQFNTDGTRIGSP
jgi:hypothetical protein